MTEQSPEFKRNERAAAYADGELSVADEAQLLRDMARDPQLAQRVLYERQLRQAVGRSMTDQSPAMPADLRGKVAASLATDSPATADASAEQPAVVGRISPASMWIPTAVAAMLLFAAVASFTFMQPDTPTGGSASVVEVAAGTDPIKVQQFQRRHVSCSLNIEEMHRSPDLDTDIVRLPFAASQVLHGKVATNLNLEEVGYRFEVAGNCAIACKPSVHVVYRASPETGRHDSISMWIAPYDHIDPSLYNGGDLPEGKVVDLTPADSPHPLVAWRHGEMVYFLVADQHTAVERATTRLRDAGAI